MGLIKALKDYRARRKAKAKAEAEARRKKNWRRRDKIQFEKYAPGVSHDMRRYARRYGGNYLLKL